MATWTDGAAYAPLERPDGFATPEAEPLEAAQPERPLTPGPMAPPRDFAPQGNVVPLAAIRTEALVERDPSEPFQVSSALLTANPLSSGERDPHQPFASSALAPSDLPPPSGPPLALPDSVPSGGGFNYPPPNPASISQNQMFHHTGFTPPVQPRLTPQQAQLQTLASVLFVIGFLFSPVATFMLLIGGGMMFRVAHRRPLAITALALGGLAVILYLIAPDWVAAVGRIGCLVTFFWSLANRQPRSTSAGYRG